MKIRPKFRLAFLLIGMVPLLVTVAIGYWRASELLREKAIDHLQSVASVKAAHIDSVMDRDLERLGLVSSRTQMRINLANFLKEPLDQYRDGIIRIIDDALASIDDFNSISIVTLEGEVIASVSKEEGRDLIGLDLSGEDYFKRGSEANCADTFLPDDKGGLKVVIAGPLVLEGQKIGVIVVESSGGAILDAVNSAEGMGETGETLLGRVGASGNAILLSRPRLAGDDYSAGTTKSTSLVAALMGQDGNYDDLIDYRGREVFAAGRNLKAGGLALVVKFDKSEALAPMKELQAAAAIMAGVLLAAILVISLLISRSVTRPLSSLARVATQLSEGDLTIRAEVGSGGEISELAEDFNRMADSLEEARRNLEAKVEERTRELELSRERFALAVRGTANGIWDWDMTRDDVFFSDRFKELLGRRPDEMQNRYEAWEVLLHPDDREATLAAIKAHLEDEEPYDVEYRLACNGGNYRWFRARGMAVRDENGVPVRMAGSISDIDEHKHAEQELLRSNRDLEQFAYIASHDLKEPLRMVASYVQLLEHRYADKLDDAAREFIGFASQGARRMKQLIDDLLVYARVGTRGKQLEPVDLSEVLAGVLDNLEVAIGDCGATITHGDLPPVMGDPTQLTQLFQNLLNNGLKFRHPERAANIHVSCEHLDGECLFKVTDNGIGIEEEFRERIFQIFQRLHSREDFEGTGIGLAVCAKIVERHHGRIWVEATEGGGSTFCFTLKPAAHLGSAI